MLGLNTNRATSSKAKRLWKGAVPAVHVQGISTSLVNNSSLMGNRVDCNLSADLRVFRHCASRGIFKNSVTYRRYHAVALPACSLKDSHAKASEYATSLNRALSKRQGW